MQESRSWLGTGDDQDGYDARQSGRIHMMGYLDIKATRESELLVKATENPTEVIPPHIHTHVTYQPTHNRSTMIYDVQVQCY